MKEKILCKKEKKDLHTEYMRCGQYINWNLKGLFITEKEDAFIVQEIEVQEIRDGERIRDSHYFEAWEVCGGRCVSDSQEEFDDKFEVKLCPWDDDELLRRSIGHTGSILFIPKVYVVKKGSDSDLYCRVERWTKGGVREAGELRSVQYTEKWKAEFASVPYFDRDIFRHEWKFNDPEVIYKVVLQYCRNAKYGENQIKELFVDDTYSSVMERILDACKK